MRFVRENSLSLFFGTLLLLTLVGQSLVGHSLYNEDATQHSQETISYPRYLASSHFGEAVMENWESEFLQFTLYIGATVWLVQKGSPESKKLEEAGRGTDEKQLLGKHARPDSPRWAKLGGWKTAIYSNSLLSEFLAIGAMVVFSVYLRQRGSPESKPVGAPDTVTGRTG